MRIGRHGTGPGPDGAHERSPFATDDGPEALLELRGASASIDEFDSPTEVDASFRTQRRVSVGYFIVFLLVTFAVPTLSLTLGWWSQARVAGGMSPSFVMAAAGLYLFFLVVGVAAATLANAIEDRMLGGSEEAAGEVAGRVPREVAGDGARGP